MSNWIELTVKDTEEKILLRADSINAVEKGNRQNPYSRENIGFAVVSGNGYTVCVKEDYYDVLSLLAKQGELRFNT